MGRPMAANQNFTATFSAELAAKDVGLALAAGEQTGVHLPAARMVFEQMQELMDQGLGDRDCSLVGKLATPAVYNCGEGPVSAPAAAGGTARSPAGAPGRSP